jgi:hypothetical protein
MDEKAKVKGSEQPNEGEGKTAARRYNEAQRRVARSGRVEEKAREAKKAIEGNEQREIERAAVIGKRHMTAEGSANHPKVLG